jgi:flagellar biosynthesis GTPase FlhF
MSKDLNPNEKQLIKGIKSDVDSFTSSLNDALKYAILAGEKLLNLKEITPYGQWETRLKTDFQDRFGDRQARRFMEIARNKTLAIELNRSENLTLEGTIKAIADATPEQLERVKQIEAERLAAEEKAKADRAAKAAELEANKAEEKTIAQVQTKEPEIIEGDFKEIKKPEPKTEEVKTGFVQIEAEKMEEIEDSLHELASLNKSISKDNDSMVKIFDANDQLGAAVKEIKRLNDLNTSLEGRLNGFMNERNALIKEAKYWRAKFEKLEKANAK